jgi:mono/diheme cytochrome c family protein
MNLKKSLFIMVLIFVMGMVFINFDKNENIIDNRWYTKEQLSLGKDVFSKNCASCHGINAEKTVKWKKTLSDGSYPSPPLNDKAHAWHHPKWKLMQIITQGGSSYDGKMPSFKKILSKEEKEASIAYFQSFWGDEFYKLWVDSSKGLEGKK